MLFSLTASVLNRGLSFGIWGSRSDSSQSQGTQRRHQKRRGMWRGFDFVFSGGDLSCIVVGTAPGHRLCCPRCMRGASAERR